MALDSRLFSGSFVALVTPMNSLGEVEFSQLRELIEWHIEQGTDGLVIMGTTGESSTVSEQEFLQITKKAIAYANGRIPVIVGCGAASTAKAVSIVEHVNPLKPDGFLCVTPYYVKPSQEGLYQHYCKVADACDAPLILYNVPGRTSCDLLNETVIRLAAHPKIIGIKDAVGDIERARQLFNAIPKGFCWFSGDDETAYDYVKFGGDGVISVTANVVPKQMSEWCELALAGNSEQAKDVFDEILPLHQAMFVESNPVPVKWALSMTGQIGEGIRLPLTHPSDENKLLIEKALRAADILS
jgi:4-hydroxy-tetrahydrodipicolinate synthase